MPQLPTLTVTDAQAARITAAFGTVENYRNWLKQQIIDYVINKEDAELQQQYIEQQLDLLNKLEQQRAARRSSTESELGGTSSPTPPV